VKVDQPCLLKQVADDGQLLGPDFVDAPEEDDREEDVIVRVQRLLFNEQAGLRGQVLSMLMSEVIEVTVGLS
jgi:hypothetical protein